MLWIIMKRRRELNVSGESSFILHPHLSLNHGGYWGSKDDFTTSFLHFSLFSSALLDLANSRPVHSLMLSSHIFCLLCPLPPFTESCKMVLGRPDKWETCPCHLNLRLFTKFTLDMPAENTGAYPWFKTLSMGHPGPCRGQMDRVWRNYHDWGTQDLVLRRRLETPVWVGIYCKERSCR